jgi:hypothetical protein
MSRSASSYGARLWAPKGSLPTARPPLPRRQNTIGLVLLRLGLAGIAALTGCGPSGVGSIDWVDTPNTRAVGAPPRLPEKTARPPGKIPKKTPEFIPG